MCHKQVSRAGTNNYIPQILWDVITCPCPWYLLLAHKSSYTLTLLFYLSLIRCVWYMNKNQIDVLFNSNPCWLTFQIITWSWCLNTLRPRQDGRHFPDNIFKCIFLNENVWISIKSSLKFVPKGPINNIPALVQIMAWRWPGDRLLSEPMVVKLLTHICVTRPQWVKGSAVSVFCLK